MKKWHIIKEEKHNEKCGCISERIVYKEGSSYGYIKRCKLHQRQFDIMEEIERLDNEWNNIDIYLHQKYKII